ncbi:MAG: hypothetical protein ACM31O_01500 [Bacteroidota bacterium]
MIWCPRCRNERSHVTDSRPAGDTVRRRRACPRCNHRWSTWETTVSPNRAAEVVGGLRRELVNVEVAAARTVEQAERSLQLIAEHMQAVESASSESGPDHPPEVHVRS